MPERPDPDYTLGHSTHELERLIDQARFFGQLTRNVLVEAGLSPEEEDPSNKLLDVHTQLTWLREIDFVDVDLPLEVAGAGVARGCKRLMIRGARYVHAARELR